MELLIVLADNFYIKYFLAGFIGGLIGKAFAYFWKFENNESDIIHSNRYYAIGIFLSGLMGGLLAIVVDQRIEFAILVGIFTDIAYTIFIKRIKRFLDKLING